MRSSHCGTRHRCKGEYAVKMLLEAELKTRGMKEELSEQDLAMVIVAVRAAGRQTNR